MTTSTSSHRTAALGGLWAVAMFVVLAGLFGMHGLASHGTGDMAAMTGVTTGAEVHPGTASVPDAASWNTAHTPPAVSATPARSGATRDGRAFEDVAHVATTDDGSSQGMVELCLAFLAAGLIALLALLARQHTRGLTVRVDRLRLNLGGLGRDRDPPSLTQLSILRC